MKNRTLVILIVGSIIIIASFSVFKMYIVNIIRSDLKEIGDSVTTQTITEEEKLNGWREEGNDRYYYVDNEKKTGWLKDDDKYYYLGTDGKMRTGWIRDKGNWYYMNDDGTMATNTTVDGCYLNENGLIEETPGKSSESDVKNPSPADIQYTTYTNDRYLFSVDYPIDFIPMEPPTNNDGRSFKRSDGKVSVTASGSNNALNESIEYYYNSALQNINGTISYNTLNDNSYAISWSENGQIKYIYSKLGAGSMNTFSLSYPESEQEKYNSMVEHIYSTFKTPGINECH